MITLKNQTLEALLFNQSIIDFRKDKRISVKTGLRFSTLFHQLRPFLDAFSDERQRLIDKYCDRDEEDKPIEKDGKMQFQHEKEAFNKEWKELLLAEVVLTDMDKIQLTVKDVPKESLSIEALEVMEVLVDFSD